MSTNCTFSCVRPAASTTMLLLALGGCSADKSSDIAPVGVVLNLAGPVRTIGQPTREALEALEYVLRDSSGRSSLTFRFEDAASDPSRAEDALARLKAAQPASHVFVSSTSPTSLRLLSALLRDTSAMLIANAGHPDLLRLGKGRVVVAFPSVDDETQAISGGVRSDRVGLVRIDDVYHDLDQVALRRLLGNRLVADEVYRREDRDFSEIAKRLRRAQVDEVVLVGLGLGYDRLMTDLLKAFDDRPPTLVVDTDYLSSDTSAYPTAQFRNVFFVRVALPDSGTSDILRRWREYYQSRVSEQPRYYADALVRTLLLAMPGIERGLTGSALVRDVESSVSSPLGTVVNGQLRMPLCLERVRGTVPVANECR